MLSHDERIATAKAVIDYICGRSADELTQPVPNCPGWTVYHAASHIGRVAIAWEAMILAKPDDPESRNRGYAEAETRPEGSPPADLASWAHQAVDHLVADPETEAYFSMTGGHGTRALWAWHAATELGVHRLDVEAALGHLHAISDDQAVDALTYTVEFFLPAMRRATNEDPGAMTLQPTAADGTDLEPIALESASADTVTLKGPTVELLLAVWGRPHIDVAAIDGDAGVLEGWRALPGKAFQFGAWD